MKSLNSIIKGLNRNSLILVILILIAAFLRFSQLGQIPAGMHEDEVAFGYNAYSLLETGRDEHGKFLPVMLESFGEYKPGLYAYLTVPVIKLLDLNSFSVRFMSAFFGTLTIVLFYFVTLQLSGNKKIALLSAILLAISPWHINLSRTVSEVVVSMFFILLMQLGVSKLSQKFSAKGFMVSIFAGILAINSYTASLFFVILVLVINLLFTFSRKKQFSLNKSVFAIFLIMLCFGIFYSSFTSINRFNQINVFSHPETKLVLEEQFREDQQKNIFTTRSFHNKIVNYTRTVIQNYSEYFTADYLFISGGNPLRQKIPGIGLFYFWQLPFLLMGMYFIFKKHIEFGHFLIVWWLVALIPGALTFDEIPNVYRSLIVLFPMITIIAVGIYESYILFFSKKALSRIIFIAVASISIWEFGYFSHQYIVHQENHHPWYRGYAFKELIGQLSSSYENYDKIVLTKGHGNPYIYVLFYNKYNPVEFHKKSIKELKNGFDKYDFTSLDCPLTGGKEGTEKVVGVEGTLYVNRGDCLDPAQNAKLMGTVYWQDNNPAFKLLEYVSTASGQLK